MKFLGAIADRILQGLIPASVARQQLMFTNTWLADVEADHDVWEPNPPLAPWEQELRDAFYMNDEQWAARQRKNSADDRPKGVAGADGPPPAVSLYDRKR